MLVTGVMDPMEQCAGKLAGHKDVSRYQHAQLRRDCRVGAYITGVVHLAKHCSGKLAGHKVVFRLQN